MKFFKKRELIFAVILILTVFVVRHVSTFSARSEAVEETESTILLTNPYDLIDWDSFSQYKANLHTHTTQSDGKLELAEVVDEYQQYGYSILSITDHNQVTWPWEKYDVDPTALNMIAIKGNEISNTHHLGSYFTDYNSLSTDEDEVLKEIGELGGIAVLYHPGRYNKPISWYANLYLKYDHLVGIEVINLGNKYKQDENTWDRILSELMPDNRVWGFANDDMHKRRHLRRDFNTFLLHELTEETLKEAIKSGHFYFSSTAVVRFPKGPVPVIKKIDIDDDKKIVSIEAEHYNTIQWISQGKVIHTGEILSYSSTKGISGYVRAVITGRGGKSFTQPFGIEKSQRCDKLYPAFWHKGL